MSDLCSNLPMDYFLMENHICEANPILTIPKFPSITEPFTFIDVNFPEEMQYAIDHLQWKKSLSHSYDHFITSAWELPDIHSGQLKESLDKAHPSNHLHSQKATDAIEKLFTDIKAQFICNDKSPSIHVQFDSNRIFIGKKYGNWHFDNEHDEKAYRITMALKNVQTPFYNNASFYNNLEVETKGYYSAGYFKPPTQTISESQVTQALPNQMALFNQASACHAFPSFKGNRLFLVADLWC